MNTELSELVKRAVSGKREYMDELIKQVQPRVRAYILRCTLNEHLTEDILQETMLQLLVSIKSLKHPERFWPWIYKIASNKIIAHFRKNKRRPSIQFSEIEEHLLESALQDTHNTGDKTALNELHVIILNAMDKLTPVQRSVLSLRCFESMQYQEIASATGCSKATARVQFLRARQKVKSSMKKQGLSKMAVLPALALFGKLTAGEALAASITPAGLTFETGLTTIETIIVTIKAYFLKTAVAAMATTTTVFLGHAAWIQTHPHPYPVRNEVQSVHYTVQGIGLLNEGKPTQAVKPSSRSSKADVDAGPYYCKGAYEQWLHFPEGPDGPIFVRMQRWGLDKQTLQRTGKLCAWLQNGSENYYYDSGGNIIYITNDPIGMLVLPTDPAPMVDFILRHSAYQDNVKYAHDRKTGLLKTKKDNRVPSVKNYKTGYAYNTLNEEDFQPFWPDNAGVIDERDSMHRRGWTYLTVKGNIGTLKIQGKGRIPFSYIDSKEHSPWLDIQVGDSIRMLDTVNGACLIDKKTGQTAIFEPGTFFAGLGRPWIGIRAFDTLRRDAASEQIPFSAKRKDELGTVTLKQKRDQNTFKILYSIDMSKDVIDTIELASDGSRPVQGRLTFSYAQQLEDWPETFNEPVLPVEISDENQREPYHWLWGLLEKGQTDSLSAMIPFNQTEYR